MRSYYKAYKKIGRINTSLARELGVDFEGTVYASPGVINHIKMHHGKQLSRKVKDNLLDIMTQIIEEPDFIGVDRRRNEEGSLEFVKKIDSTLLLGLQIDLDEKYIYVSTLYPITKGKINNKIYSGRLISYNKLCNA